MGTDENLFRLLPVLEHGARVLPLESEPVPGYGAQISARSPTKGPVQTGARAGAPTLNRAFLFGVPCEQSCMHVIARR